jgi:hypothetical protein
MTAIRRPAGPPDNANNTANNTVDKTRGNRTDAAIDAMSPPAMAGNTLMDGAAGQLPGSPPQVNYDLGGPDSDEDE